MSFLGGVCMRVHVLVRVCVCVFPEATFNKGWLLLLGVKGQKGRALHLAGSCAIGWLPECGGQCVVFL